MFFKSMTAYLNAAHQVGQQIKFSILDTLKWLF